MYYHGASLAMKPQQFTRVATSTDGLEFTALEEILGLSYWRSFRWHGMYYGLAMPGYIYRSKDPLTGYEHGPTLFGMNMRHSSLDLIGDVLHVYYTNVGDCPESILLSKVDLTMEWRNWKASEPIIIMKPETAYEGAKEPLLPSVRGACYIPTNQLRDPYIFRDPSMVGGPLWLFYAIAGEQGIAVATIAFLRQSEHSIGTY